MAAKMQRVGWTDEEQAAFKALCQRQNLPMSIKLASLVRAELAKAAKSVAA